MSAHVEDDIFVALEISCAHWPENATLNKRIWRTRYLPFGPLAIQKLENGFYFPNSEPEPCKFPSTHPEFLQLTMKKAVLWGRASAHTQLSLPH